MGDLVMSQVKNGNIQGFFCGLNEFDDFDVAVLIRGKANFLIHWSLCNGFVDDLFDFVNQGRL
jgi:hypothetical protein